MVKEAYLLLLRDSWCWFIVGVSIFYLSKI